MIVLRAARLQIHRTPFVHWEVIVQKDSQLFHVLLESTEPLLARPMRPPLVCLVQQAIFVFWERLVIHTQIFVLRDIFVHKVLLLISKTLALVVHTIQHMALSL